MSDVVEVRDLYKSFGSVKAVDGISFSVQSGKIYGLLGRNGAGKTTIMQMIAAQLFATDGEIKVFGQSSYENNRVLSRICFIKESQKYPEHFLVEDVLALAPSIFPNWDEEFAYSLIEQFQLPLKRRIKKLSRGMLSSVGIVVGLASRAPLTMFDEPYLGLDAVARGLFYDRLIEDYAEHPRTIILSTHLIDEVSRILEHVLVIDRGKLILDEETEALREQAFAVAGTASTVDTFIAGKRTISREPFGTFVSASILGSLNAAERQRAVALGLELAPVSLQQLIVHLTNGKSGGKEAEAL
ncbi:ABC transporter ATP-binding protein YtrB [Paenibacillus konkukensis]|uniref:ABC transporter ATP-binding protein YtrB n=1 Tax=Paenibacillus konkukensis TaxID=2020716 RepID=A0ABY4RUH9_9BACL|nr:ABC transporter ATP-binding protein [Paenibacillus konkukensis]UQZ85034.1 ABC transporter ATP-binding protein YtrB [Paenibacillus konkukensis]